MCGCVIKQLFAGKFIILLKGDDMSTFFHRSQVPNTSQIADDYIVFSNTIINACETISHTLHHFIL